MTKKQMQVEDEAGVKDEPVTAPPSIGEAELKKKIEQELIEKARRQQNATAQINKILEENGMRLVVEQNIRVVPNQ